MLPSISSDHRRIQIYFHPRTVQLYSRRVHFLNHQYHCILVSSCCTLINVIRSFKSTIILSSLSADPRRVQQYSHPSSVQLYSHQYHKIIEQSSCTLIKNHCILEESRCTLNNIIRFYKSFSYSHQYLWILEESSYTLINIIVSQNSPVIISSISSDPRSVQSHSHPRRVKL